MHASTSAPASRSRSSAAPSNFEAGATVAVALPGAVLPDGTELRVAKLRGVESHGMMLSERELELGQEHDGIMLLPDDWPVGDALIDHLAIADDVLEFEITSNRPDCQNVYGIAREVSAVLDTDLAPWPGTEPAAEGAGTADDYVTARIDAPDMCPRWAGAGLHRRQGGPVAAVAQGPHRGCRACARSRTSSTSRTTSCWRSASPRTRSTSTRSPAARSSSAGRTTASP